MSTTGNLTKTKTTAKKGTLTPTDLQNRWGSATYKIDRHDQIAKEIVSSNPDKIEELMKKLSPFFEESITDVLAQIADFLPSISEGSPVINLALFSLTEADIYDIVFIIACAFKYGHSLKWVDKPFMSHVKPNFIGACNILGVSPTYSKSQLYRGRKKVSHVMMAYPWIVEDVIKGLQSELTLMLPYDPTFFSERIIMEPCFNFKNTVMTVSYYLLAKQHWILLRTSEKDRRSERDMEEVMLQNTKYAVKSALCYSTKDIAAIVNSRSSGAQTIRLETTTKTVRDPELINEITEFVNSHLSTPKEWTLQEILNQVEKVGAKVTTRHESSMMKRASSYGVKDVESIPVASSGKLSYREDEWILGGTFAEVRDEEEGSY